MLDCRIIIYNTCNFPQVFGIVNPHKKFLVFLIHNRLFGLSVIHCDFIVLIFTINIQVNGKPIHI